MSCAGRNWMPRVVEACTDGTRVAWLARASGGPALAEETTEHVGAEEALEKLGHWLRGGTAEGKIKVFD